MSRHAVTILDPDRMPVARADVALEAGRYSGAVDLGWMPEPLRRLFEEYEEIVEGQVFSLLDPIEDRVAAAGLLIAFDDGRTAAARDLQIFPGGGRVSFEVAEERDPSRPAELRREIAIGADQADRGQVRPFDDEVVAEIKARGRETFGPPPGGRSEH